MVNLFWGLQHSNDFKPSSAWFSEPSSGKEPLKKRNLTKAVLGERNLTSWTLLLEGGRDSQPRRSAFTSHKMTSREFLSLPTLHQRFARIRFLEGLLGIEVTTRTLNCEGISISVSPALLLTLIAEFSFIDGCVLSTGSSEICIFFHGGIASDTSLQVSPALLHLIYWILQFLSSVTLQASIYLAVSLCHRGIITRLHSSYGYERDYVYNFQNK